MCADEYQFKSLATPYVKMLALAIENIPHVSFSPFSLCIGSVWLQAEQSLKEIISTVDCDQFSAVLHADQAARSMQIFKTTTLIRVFL